MIQTITFEGNNLDLDYFYNSTKVLIVVGILENEK